MFYCHRLLLSSVLYCTYVEYIQICAVRLLTPFLLVLDSHVRVDWYRAIANNNSRNFSPLRNFLPCVLCRKTTMI